MTKDELITEVTEFIKTEIQEEDGEVDLGTAGAALGEFVDSLQDEDEDESPTGDESPSSGE